MKPNGTFKSFNGQLVSKCQLEEFKKRVLQGEFHFDEEEKIVLAKKRSILEEYRLFIIDNKIITGCKYMYRYQLALEKELPQEVVDFAQQVINNWTPEKAFVLDIGKTNLGYKVIEVNCINSAGVYLCDAEKIILALEEFYSN